MPVTACFLELPKIYLLFWLLFFFFPGCLFVSHVLFILEQLLISRLRNESYFVFCFKIFLLILVFWFLFSWGRFFSYNRGEKRNVSGHLSPRY